MSTIPWLADIWDLSGFEVSFLVLALIIACLAAGYFTDALLAQMGFGPAANGVLALAGALIGVYARYRFLGFYHSEDGMVTICFALVAALALFATISAMRSRA